MRVVVAEDLALLRDGLIRLLTAHGFDVVKAVDNGPCLLRALTALIVDLSALSRVQVNADGTAVIGAGARLIDVYAALSEPCRCFAVSSATTRSDTAAGDHRPRRRRWCTAGADADRWRQVAVLPDPGARAGRRRERLRLESTGNR